MPDLEYTLYQPQQLKSRVPALMIHGFATRGEQLYGGTSWIRQYLRAGYPVLIVTLPYHSDEYPQRPRIHARHRLQAPRPYGRAQPHNPVRFGAPCRCGRSASTPMHLFTNLLAQLLRTVAIENDLGVELEPRAHVIGFSFGARRLGTRPHPPGGGRILTLGGLPLHDHLITLRAMLEAHEGTSVTADSETPAADSHRRGDCLLHLDY